MIGDPLPAWASTRWLRFEARLHFIVVLILAAVIIMRLGWMFH